MGHRTGWLAAAAIALAGLTVQSAMASGHTRAPSQAATVKSLVSAANSHRLTSVNALFTSSASLTLGTRQWHGRAALDTWWKGQFTHKVHLTLSSTVDSSGAVAHFVLYRTTTRGDCPKGCYDGAQARFSGSHIATLVLTKLRTPASTAGSPSPPTPGPPPKANVTPTIPS